jgi:hypothetical protein
VRAPEIERLIALPALPNRTDSSNILPHPWSRSRPRHTVSALNVGPHLWAQT